ncbi:MAG: hypothetical protein J5825_06745 [Lachnospiraceae bacterium]|nr:hypothetical protein [Lachnospiraceae bacterium]
MERGRKEFHVPSLIFLLMIFTMVILLVSTMGEAYLRSRQKKNVAVVKADSFAREEPQESGMTDSVSQEINLTSYGVSGQNYYKLVNLDEGQGYCISLDENSYSRKMAELTEDESGVPSSEEVVDTSGIAKSCRVSFKGLRPGKAVFEYYECDGSLEVNGSLPSYDALCSIYGSQTDLVLGPTRKRLAKFLVVVDKTGNITVTEEK